MITKPSRHKQWAVTKVEVVLIVACLAVLSAIFFSALSRARKKTSKIWCANHVKQVTLSFLIWSHENNDKLPMQISSAQGGSMEWNGSKHAYRHFLVLSNEMPPRLLTCPDDQERIQTTNWLVFKNENLSYCLNLLANQSSNSISLLLGDRHWVRDGMPYANGCYLISTQTTLGWGEKPHEYYGYLSLTDGSAHRSTSTNLPRLLTWIGRPTNWLAFP